MTFTELMIDKFPNANIENLVVDCCPENFGYQTITTMFLKKYGQCFEYCDKCWNSEIVEVN